MTLLILGGTAEARDIAAQLEGRDIVSSLAGRVARPRLPVGPVRIGGFGGIEGLRGYLREEAITAVVDATHPFAEQISRHAALACAMEAVPLLRLERPGWEGTPEWNWVDDHDEAARLTASLGRRPMLTTGRRALPHFVDVLADHEVLVRLVDAPDSPLPGAWTVILGRGPYTANGERDLMLGHGVDVVVSKDSGGSFTWPKMRVAADHGIEVVVVRRAPGPVGVETVTQVSDARSWAVRQI